MTKKYTVESSRIVRKIVGRPSCSDKPVLKLTKTIAEKIMASEIGDPIEREISDGGGDGLPKNSDSDMYTSSNRGDLVNMHRL